METIKTNRYMFLYPTDNSKKRYQIDRYAEYKPGDKVAVKRGNSAHVEVLSENNKDKRILGKAINVYQPLP